MNHQRAREGRMGWTKSSRRSAPRIEIAFVVVILLSTTTTSRHVLQAVEAYHAGPSVPGNKSGLKWKNRLGPFYNHPARRLPNHHHLKASKGEEDEFENPRTSGKKKSSLSLFAYFGFQPGFPNSLIFLSLSKPCSTPREKRVLLLRSESTSCAMLVTSRTVSQWSAAESMMSSLPLHSA